MSTIGFFDSGLGGLSILQLALAQMPEHDYVYLADTAHNPYGERSGEWIKARGLEIVRYLSLTHGCKVIVVACNTATAEAITDIRANFPDLRIIGVEPGIKPATLTSASKRVGILATKATLQSKKFNDLIASMPEGFEFIKIAGTGLVEMIEQTHRDDAQIKAWLREHLSEVRARQVDTLVLGCTHYPFIKDLIQDHLGAGVRLVDTGQAVVNHLANHLSQPPHANEGHTSSAQLHFLCNVDPQLFVLKAQKLLRDTDILACTTQLFKL